MHARRELIVFAGDESAGPQKVHDSDQLAVRGVSNRVFLRRGRANVVRVLDTDGTERGLLGRPVFRVHRRSVRAEAQRRPDVRHERVLFRRLVNTDGHLRRDQAMAIDAAGQRVDSDRQHRDPTDGNRRSRSRERFRASISNPLTCFTDAGFAHVVVGQRQNRKSPTHTRQATGMGVARKMPQRIPRNGCLHVREQQRDK